MNVTVLSETKQEFMGKVYYRCGFYYQRNGVRLHREVYKRHYGQIPKGYFVHHIDGNRDNNDISNLMLKEAGQHSSDHAREPERMAYGRMHIERIRPLASKWHKSEAGRAWHSELGKRAWGTRTEQEYICKQCGKAFHTKRIYGENENAFCSNCCKSAHRRESGVDNEQRICHYCGNAFTVNKYSKTRTCSRECAQGLRFSNESQSYTLCRES